MVQVGMVLLAAVAGFRAPAVAPVETTGEPVAFWWDEQAFHVGKRAFAWADIGVKPVDGCNFKSFAQNEPDCLHETFAFKLVAVFHGKHIILRHVQDVLFELCLDVIPQIIVKVCFENLLNGDGKCVSD